MILFFKIFIYLSEKQSTQVGEEGGRGISTLWAQSRAWSQNQDHDRAEIKSQTFNQPRRPYTHDFKFVFNYIVKCSRSNVISGVTALLILSFENAKFFVKWPTTSLGQERYNMRKAWDILECQKPKPTWHRSQLKGILH